MFRNRDGSKGYDHVEVNITGNYNLSGPQGMGYYANHIGTTTIDAETILITTNGRSADGIRTNNRPTVIINGQLTIKAQGSSGDGINAANSNNSGALVQIKGENTHIESQGGIGVRANLTRNLMGNTIEIGKNATIVTRGSGNNYDAGAGYAVYAGDRERDPVNLPFAGSAKVSIADGSLIQTFGNEAYAVYANKTGIIQLGITEISTVGTEAHGIVAEDGIVDYGYYTFPSWNIGWNSYGQITHYAGGQVYLTGNTKVTVDTSKNSHAMYASGVASRIVSTDSAGVQKSGVYKVTGDLVADREGGINLNATAGSIFNSNINVTGIATPTSGTNSFVNVQMAGGQFTGDINAAALGTSNLNVSGSSVVTGNINAKTSGVVTLSASNSTFTGNVEALDSGIVRLNLANGAVFNGITNKVDPPGVVPDGIIDINLDTNAKWFMGADSNVTNLTLNNGAAVYVDHGATGLPITTADVATLTVKNLGGNGGVFHVRSNVFTQISDQIVITESSLGTHRIHFDDSNTGGCIGTEKTPVVRFVGTDHNQNRAEFVSDGVDVGAYVYQLERADRITRALDTDWYLLSRPATPGPDPWQPPLTNTANNSANILNINYLMNYAENQTLLQRMGELRQAAPDSMGDVWGRVYTGQMDKFDGVRLSGFDFKYSGIQLGVDRELNLLEDGRVVYVGVMGGMTKGDADYAVGSGDSTSYHVGVYGTYKNDNGFYVDGILKYMRMDNSFNTLTSNGYMVNGDGDTSGFSIGVEVGKRFYISEPAQGWYLEPQAQLTYSHQSGATVKSSNGLRTDLDSYDSTLGRLSVIAGYSITEGKNPIDVYIKTGYVREFSGDTGYTFNHYNHESYDFGGGWWDNSIGLNVQVDERHNFYLDATYAKGGSFDHKQLNVGYRYSF